jgi:hypothetical protein
MPSVSKNLKEICEDSALNHTATARTVFPDKREHLQSVVRHDYSVAIGNPYLD